MLSFISISTANLQKAGKPFVSIKNRGEMDRYNSIEI